jgi:hypothetical protein
MTTEPSLGKKPDLKTQGQVESDEQTAVPEAPADDALGAIEEAYGSGWGGFWSNPEYYEDDAKK